MRIGCARPFTWVTRWVPISCCSSALTRGPATEALREMRSVLPSTSTPETSSRISAWMPISGSIER